MPKRSVTEVPAERTAYFGAVEPRLKPWPGLASRPRLVHADWSGSNDAKRWCAIAEWKDGQYVVSEPSWIGDASSWLHAQLAVENLMLGFDFAMGLSRKLRPQDAHFLEVLRLAPTTFFAKASQIAEVSLERPFFCGRGKGVQQTWASALGQTTADDLRRACERGAPLRSYRRAAQISLWCVGAGHVGTATAHGWQNVLNECLQHGADIWPFQSTDLAAAFAGDNTPRVVVETYPADAYSVLGIGGNAKTQHAWRTRAGQRILEVLDATVRDAVVLEPALHSQLRAGFGSGADGEDRFDAVAGALVMALVALGRRDPGLPASDVLVHTKEGWILGCD